MSDRACEVVSSSAIECFREAGIQAVHFVVRAAKWDIVRYWGDGRTAGVSIAYHVVPSTPGTPHTVNSVYPFIKDKIVAMAFPDIVYHPTSILTSLLEHLANHDHDIVLALFPTDRPEKVDTVDLTQDGTVENILVKTADSQFRTAWAAAVWNPRFTDHIRLTLRNQQESATNHDYELSLGHVFINAKSTGLSIGGITFNNGFFRDIGTPDEWSELLSES